MSTCVHAQSCPSLFDLMDCSPRGSPVHTIFPERTLELVVISSSNGSSQPRNQTLISCVSCIDKWILCHWVTWEAPTSTCESTKQILQRRICLLLLISVPSIDASTQEVFTKCCCCSVAKSCPTPCYPKDCRTQGFPVLHYLLEFAQTHVHWVVMLSKHFIFCCPLLLSPSSFPTARSVPMSWLFTSGGQIIGASASASVLPVNI